MTPDRAELAASLLDWSAALEDERISLEDFLERKGEDVAELLDLAA